MSQEDRLRKFLRTLNAPGAGDHYPDPFNGELVVPVPGDIDTSDGNVIHIGNDLVMPDDTKCTPHSVPSDTPAVIIEFARREK